jgi:undecaprenyl-diphosphatase
METPPDVIDDLLTSDLLDDPTWSAREEPADARSTARRRRRWGRQAALAAVTLGAFGSFVAISRTIAGSDGSPFDRAVVRAVGRVRHPFATLVVRGVTSLGGVGGAVGVALAALTSARRRPRLALQIAIGSLGGVSAELCIKRIFKRERPALLAHLEEVRSTSFPSGHSMAASSLYLTLAFVASRSRRLRAHRGLALAAAGSLASAIGASRVYLGVHWPTDVLGGLALGTAWASLTEAVFDLTGAERALREAAKRKPLADAGPQRARQVPSTQPQRSAGGRSYS